MITEKTQRDKSQSTRNQMVENNTEDGVVGNGQTVGVSLLDEEPSVQILKRSYWRTFCPSAL